MKYIKTFERFGSAAEPATKPAPSPKPATTPAPRPEKPTRPSAPSKPITTPSIDPGPLANSEQDVVNRLEKELGKRGEKLSDFVRKNKK